MQFALVPEISRPWRAFLFCSTALSALLSPLMAAAQIAPGATPQGGVVAGGAASITQGAASTTINQVSQSAAINWQSFNVGAAAQVRFNQPNAAATTLNRVVGGDLSEIDGQISANGQIVLINQSGVVFGRGAQVNAESVVVSTSDIAPGDFMAGRMNFTGAPKPGAKIVNNGNITARDAGLVGLVAPQVANNGVITAALGQVVLAGGSAFTLDLYGDRLISLDVTQAVRAVDVDGKSVPALVTNSGLIIADGGKVTLTAQDADALVTQLVSAGGTIRADTAGGQAGTISVLGVGGNISIAGNLLARGLQAGTQGGGVQALAGGTVAVAPGADIDVSGAAGGGHVAIGTDLARAIVGPADTMAPAAGAVTVAAGAVLDADATALGNAGTVTLLSAQETGFSGAISVRGGPNGGNGGLAEISSRGVIDLGGTVLATASDGGAGEILLDPRTLVVVIGGNAAGTSVSGAIVFGGAGTTPRVSLVDPSELNSLSGVVVLEAADLISIASAIDMTTNGNELTLDSGGAVDIGAPVTVPGGGLDIEAGNGIDIGAGLNAAAILLNAGTGALQIDAPVIAGGDLALEGSGSVFESGAGQIIAAKLTSYGAIGGDVFLTAGNNSITAIGAPPIRSIQTGFAAFGTFALNDAVSLDVAGTLAAGDVTLAAPAVTVDGSVYAGTISGAPGSIMSEPAILAIAADRISLNAAQALQAPGGTIEIAPDSYAGIDVLGTDAADLDLSAGFFADLDTAAAALVIGRAAGFEAAFVTLEGDLSLPYPALILAAASRIIDLGTLAMAGTAATVGIDGGGVTQGPGGLIITGVLQGDGLPVTGAVLLSSPRNLISTLGGISLANGAALQVNDDTELVIDGPVSTLGDVSLSAAGAGQPGAAAIDEVGAGQISASTLSGMVTNGNLLLGNAANEIGTLGAISVAGAGTLTVNDGEPLDVGGLVTVGGEVFLGAPAIGESAGGLIAAGELAGYTSIAGGVTLTQPNRLASLGAFGAGGAFDLDNVVPLDVVGALLAQDVLIAAPGIAVDAPITAGATAAPGVLALAADTLSVAGYGALRAPDGTIELAPYLAVNGIDVNGGGGDLNLSGALLAGLDPAAAEILLGQAGPYQAANITLEGNATVASPLLVLATPGEITESGQLTASTLEFNGDGFVQTGTAAIFAGLLQGDGAAITGDVLLGDAGNRIATLGSITTGSFSLDLGDAAALSVTGPVTGQDITLVDGAGIDVTGGVFALDQLLVQAGGALTQSGGTLTAPAATLDAVGGITLNGDANFAVQLVLNSDGEILHGSGQLAAGTLAGGAGGLASFGGFTDFGTIAGFSDGGGLVELANSGPLTIDGPLIAGALSLTADGLLSLDGAPAGGIFITGGGGTGDIVSALTAAGGIVQSGVFYINAGPYAAAYLGTGNADPALILATPGNIAFANAPLGLVGPSTDLLLSAGGSITGNVLLQGVTILNAQSTQLFGSLDGVSGGSAASLGFVYPAPAITQLFNDCEIEANNCGAPLIEAPQVTRQITVPDISVLFGEIVPADALLPLLNIDARTRRKRNPDVHTPGVANADF